jgi:hypothetical protein
VNYITNSEIYLNYLTKEIFILETYNKSRKNETNPKIGWIKHPIILVFESTFSRMRKKISFLSSSVVPAAEGTVAISQDKNQNYKIDLTLKRLAEPSRLSAPKNV